MVTNTPHIVTYTIHGYTNFALHKKLPRMTNPHTEIPEAMYNDEIVCYIASRYHSTPQEVIRCFSEQDRLVPKTRTTPASFRLTENEMAILRDMTAFIRRTCDKNESTKTFNHKTI